MAYTTQELIDIFRLTIPAMPATEVTDAELESDIDLYRDYVSERRFGKLFPKALAYFIAHMRSLNETIMNSGGGADPSFNTGVLIREKEGDLERQYAAPSSESSSSNTDEMLKKTIYGQMFLQLRAMCIIPVTVRQGGGCCGWSY